MALPSFAPAITKTRQAIAQSSQRAILKLVPELETGKPITNKSLTVLATSLMIMVILTMFLIASLSTQDAFTLAKLQRQEQTLSDQRAAIDREIAFRSSASALAAKATKLGMKPNTQPRFIDLSEATNG